MRTQITWICALYSKDAMISSASSSTTVGNDFWHKRRVLAQGVLGLQRKYCLICGGAEKMNVIDKILDTFPLMILDGAFATQLEARGCNLKDPLWSAKILMEDPDLIAAVHREYFDAGADCAITASYQATVEGFQARGMTLEEAERLIRLSVEICSKVRDDFWAGLGDDEKLHRPKPIVAASVGPYGAYLADGSEYRGDYLLDEDELYDFHRRRMALLVAAGPDILACETIPCMKEAKAVVRCMQEHPDISGWVSFSCRDGHRLRNGELIAECAEWLNQFEQVAAIGVNCTEPQYVASLIGEIRSRTTKPVVVYPNSGEIYDKSCNCWTKGSDLPRFSVMVRAWYQAGARLIGGCCRTSPADIRAINNWAKTL